MEPRERVDERIGDARHRRCIGLHRMRHLAAEDHAPYALHEVARRAEHVAAVERERLGDGDVPVEPLEDRELALHVVPALHVGPVRRAAEHEFAVADADEVRQVREPARKLLDR